MQQATVRQEQASTNDALQSGSAPPRFRLIAARERPRVERFIAGAYHAAYGARITSFMPQLAAVERDHELVAACGLRCAGTTPLFLETYLAQPVELALAQAAKSPVARTEIVEVGNLAITRPGAARLLITLLTAHLLTTTERWVVFTAVPALRNNFVRMRIPLHVLGEARPDRLDAETRRQWGRYYDAAPQVTGVRIAEVAAALGLAG